MSQPFVGEIAWFGFNFAPRGWAFCNGQLLPIAQNQALFSLLGTTYGGNGIQTFGLPNLQSRVAIGFSSTYTQGMIAGEENHTLLITEIPTHLHQVAVNGTASDAQPVPSGTVVLGKSSGANSTTLSLYGPNTVGGALSPQAIGMAGSNQPHPNLAPYLTINYCIALQGIFPSRN
jgi:microcystin-dependent protein